tara:strand:+ start:25 stop:180 length:156 start_codon:yes stop_codon:yes gene_type:complete
MKFNSKLIIEKTKVTEKLLYQLNNDITTNKLTSEMLKDLLSTIQEMITTDF